MDNLRRNLRRTTAITVFMIILAIMYFEGSYRNIMLMNMFNATFKPQICDPESKDTTELLRDLVHPIKPCILPPLIVLDDFYDYGKREKAKCDNLTEVGGIPSRQNDGSKFVCFDDRFKIIPGNCVVLSFGIDNEWSFDDAMDKYGCNVYSFDPTMDKNDFDRSPRIHFFNLGLSNFKGEKLIRNKPRKVDRYENILNMLNLTSKPIDYLKMDIEGSELEFFHDIFNRSSHLLQDIKQISMEIHTSSPPRSEYINAIRKSIFFSLWIRMHMLECHGFKLLHFEKNPVKVNHYQYRNRNESYCYEVVWVKDPI